LRLAWFSPWPPDPSGVAGRSAEVTALLAARDYAIDVYVDERRIATGRLPARPPARGEIRVLSAHDFIWREARTPYDLVVYQVGNSHLHEHVWPYLFRWPGLAVLHDARLHHARALALLSRGRADDYRVEFGWNHPHVDPRGAELGLGAFDGTYHYQWPMVRGVLDSSRLAATHARGAIPELEAQSTGQLIDYIALGEGIPAAIDGGARATLRAAHGIPPGAVVFGVFGGLTVEKRLPEILRSFAAVRRSVPHALLVLAGEPERVLDLDARIKQLDLAGATLTLGRLDDRAFDAWIGAVDVSLNLRWPTALETSGPWLRALSAARPTVIIDLAHMAHVPTLDPRTWVLHAPARPGAGPPIAVSLDIRDEEHSLRLAMYRLAIDTDLREMLGRRARAYWEGEHTVGRMTDDYIRVMARAMTRPAPSPDRPSHMAPDPWAHTRHIAASLGPAAADAISRLAGSSAPTSVGSTGPASIA
jgi:glycosyltransferase involved in cell wall biosynthesis